MRFLALATDYDGTLAHDGVVTEATVQALKKLRASGRKLLLVTGRELTDLMATFPAIHLFDRIVAENGALVYDPESKRESLIGEAPPPQFLKALQARKVDPIALGKIIVATLDSQKDKVLDAVHAEGIECQIIFNKGSLMILPSGVNKATGFKAALAELGLSPHNVVGVGDAENDHAFLSACEAGVAVANALPSLKERADWVTAGARGEGVEQLIEQLITGDLASVSNNLRRCDIPVGDKLAISPYGSSIMVAGTSGGGKSTLTTGIMERLQQRCYQMCVIDPEGDYPTFPGSVVVGDAKRAPNAEEVLELLRKPDQSVVVNLLGVTLEHRPEYFQHLLPRLSEYRLQTGRPHWVVIDEAHHVLPTTSGKADMILPKELSAFLLITLDPSHVDRTVVGMVDRIIAVGEHPGATIQDFAQVCSEQPPNVPDGALEKGRALTWSRSQQKEVIEFQVIPSTLVSTRHSRKYATAELTPDRSFFFRGPEGKLNLRAQNLVIFSQLLEGVDDETWLFHFNKGEYSKWFRENIKSDELADAVQAIEKRRDLPAAESRKAIRQEIDQRFTLPA